jgi:hypothetical protein
MPTPNDFIAAVTGKNPALLESALIKRVIYVFAEGENPADFVALEDGVVPLALSLADTRSIFWLDPDDASSVHDGVAVIVTSDGKRYHATDFQYPNSVKAVAQNTPGTTTLGFAYHVGAAPTGAWSSHAGAIAIYTSRGWVYLTPRKGQIFLNEADDLYYAKNDASVFAVVPFTPGATTIRDTHIIGGARRYIVENQTTNTAATPPTGLGAANGYYWIVGPSPTGPWSGQAGKIATTYDDVSWTFITAKEGDEAYDKALNANFIYNGGWISGAGAYIKRKSATDTASASLSAAGSGDYTYSATTAPTSAQLRRVETLEIDDFAANASSALIEVEYSADLSLTPGDTNVSDNFTIYAALFLDSETNARDWCVATRELLGTTHAAVVRAPLQAKFIIAAPDASAHDYKIMFYIALDNMLVTTFAVSRRRLIVREAA